MLLIKKKFDVGVFATGLNPMLSSIMQITRLCRETECAPCPPECATDLACNVALARKFDETIDESDAFIPDAVFVEREVAQLCRKYRLEFMNDNFICVYPSTDLPHRPRWPIENLLVIIRRFKEDGINWKIVVVGSAIEGRDWDKVDTEKIADVNLAGKMSIQETASLLKRCNLTIGNDGGLMHVAGALDCPLVNVMTNTPLRYKPPGNNTIIVHSSMTCCDEVYPNRPTDCVATRCCGGISIDSVYDACFNLIRLIPR